MKNLDAIKRQAILAPKDNLAVVAGRSRLYDACTSITVHRLLFALTPAKTARRVPVCHSGGFSKK